MPFIANTDEQRKQMLSEIGLTMEDLFADIPPQLRRDGLNIPPGLTEQQVRTRIESLADRNAPQIVSFLGGGFYEHFIPAAVDAIASRSEFYTAYTPYQPELSQGTLQAIYEYQSAMCRLTEMQVANASLYDGGTALYEAIMMAMRCTGRGRVMIDETVSPIYRVMIRSYTRNLGIELIETSARDGLADRDAIGKQMNDATAAIIVQNPNFFGCIDDFTDIAALAHKHGALLVVSCYPVSLGMLKTPGAMGADIATGEGQSLGLDLGFGGPYLGFMATRAKLARKMPGRIAGRTVDNQNRQGFVLTLQAREQHIRREKATSNICTNEGLCALRALVHLCLLGKTGLVELAQLCLDKAHYAHKRLTAIEGVSAKFPARCHFNEFTIELPKPADGLVAALLQRGIAGGIPLGRYFRRMDRCLLVALTEKRTREQIDLLADSLEAML